MGVILCLIPVALLTGPFIPDAIISIISILFITITIKERLWDRYFYNKYFIFIFIFYLYFLFASFASENIILSLEASFFYFRFIIFALAVWFLLDSDKNLIKKFTIYFLITFCIAITDGYYQYYFENNIFGFENSSEDRMTLTFNSKLILGGYLSRLLPLLFALVIYNFSKNKKIIIFLFSLIILIDCLVFLSGERTAIGILSLFTIMVLLLVSKFKLLRLITISISITFIVFIALSNTATMDRNVYYTLNQISPKSDDTNIPTFFSLNHQSLAIASINMYKDNKYIGAGPKQFRVLCDKYVNQNSNQFCSTHPHNSYLQLLAETGIVGVLFTIIPFIFLIYIFIKHMINKLFKSKSSLSDYQLCLLICIFLSLWPILPTQNFFNNWINIIYYLPIGFFLHSIYLRKTD
jgi:O-antigen ligase|tara:strand:- start:472 stop:1698 length:1227 start_codon:yes stop_codon:yes gene_type:complete